MRHAVGGVEQPLAVPGRRDPHRLGPVPGRDQRVDEALDELLETASHVGHLGGADQHVHSG